MITNKPSDNEKALDKVLGAWEVQAQLPPRFQENVWRRIELAQPRRRSFWWETFSQWIAIMLPRPALATAYVAVLMAAGGMAGWTHARQSAERVQVELGERYVQRLNPYQTGAGEH